MNGRVLVVEDDPQLGPMVVAVLEGEGYEVVYADDADAALVELASPRRLSALLTDNLLGGAVTGVELVALARSHRPALRCVLMTADPGSLKGYVLAADVCLLRKPMSYDEILGAVDPGRAG